MFDELQDLYQQVIIDHSRRPRNNRRIETANRTAKGRNPLCGDTISLYAVIENDLIKDISFEATACAICTASASIMTEALMGKPRQEAETAFQQFHDMVTTGTPGTEELGKLSAFAGVNKFPARVKCAILPWHALKSTLDNSQDVVSTE